MKSIFFELFNIYQLSIINYEPSIKSIKFEREKCKIVHNQ